MFNNLFGLLTTAPAPVAAAPGASAGLVTGLSVLLGLIAVALIVIILLQKKRASGIGAAIAGTGETYWSKNKGNSIEGSLEKYTKILGAAFMLVALIINVIV